MRLIRGPLIVCLLGLLVAPVASAQDAKPTIFVGALVRDGFVDMDAGIRDSIRDIQQELQQTAAFTVGRTRDTPTTIVLTVLARGIVTNGSVGFGSSSAVGGTGSGFGFVVPNNVPTLTTLLNVGVYERRMQSEGPTWGRAAKVVVQDLLAWWEANSAAVRALR
jgi:hypothetical protein